MLIWLPTLWIATGICLFAGLHFLTVGHSKGNAYLFTSFGVMCLTVAAYIGLSALMQTPQSLLRWIVLERLHIAAACLAYPAAVWFIALYSRLRNWRPWVIASAVIFGAMLVLDAVLPNGLLLSSFRIAPPLVLPWGESINQVTTTSTRIAVAFYAATLLAFCWAFWRCWALVRQGERRRARSLAIYLALQVAAVAYAEYATIHALPGLDWDALPFLILVLVVSQTLTLELRRGAAALQEENTRRAQAEARLRQMAYTDAISGLPNRHALGEWLATTLAAEPRPHGALVVIDPARFAVINHALGHQAGDLLIREIGERLARVVGSEGHVARLDGDEFAAALLVPPGDADAALARVMAAARRMRHELTAPSQVADQAPSASMHIGLAMFEDAGDDDTLLRRAYAALQVAKHAGHNEPVAFAPSMQAEAERRLRLEADLRAAIAQRQLHLVYQPQLDRSGSLVGAEALVRWQHPEFGAVSPLEFIPIAEESGQTPALGAFVLREACTMLAGLDRLENFRLAVNISPQQLFLASFLDTVRAAIEASAIDPRRLTLEITETVFIHDIPDAATKLDVLNALGIRVSVDDFGTGYASIASLKAFPVHELKIDQSFVRDMSTTQPDRFVAAMIALGRALDIDVVAEGIERADQHARLMEMGCDIFQGYLLGGPDGADALVRRIGHGVVAGHAP